MRAKIVGLEYVDYQRSKDNKRICGFSVHIVKEPHSSKSQNFNGLETDKVWVSNADTRLFEKLRSIPVNMDYDFIYEYDGRFTSLVDIIEFPVNKSDKKEV